MLTQNLNVRADKKSVVPVAHMVQGDSGRRLTCIVQDYDIPSGSSASLSVERPDGNVYIASATISNNNVSAMITSTMLEVVGIVKGTMRITSSGSVVSTFEFVIKVEEAAGAGIEPSPADGNVYVYINGEKVKVVTDPDLEAVKSELSESIIAIKEAIANEVYFDFSSLGNSSRPYGWTSGYYNGDTGVETSSGYFIRTNTAISLSAKGVIELTPPHGYAIGVFCIREDGTHTVYGAANSQTHPEAINQIVTFRGDEFIEYRISVGRFPSSSSTGWCNNEEIVSQIKFKYTEGYATDEIPDMKEDIVEIDLRVTELENKDGEIAEWFETEAIATIASAKELQSEPCVVFPIITDIHYKSATENPDSFDLSIENIKRVSKDIKYDFVLNLGDNTDGDQDRSVTLARNDYMLRRFNEINAPYIQAIGNHDTNYYKSGHLFSIEEVYRSYLSNTKNVVSNFAMNGTDYLFDYDDLGVRFVVLNANAESRYKFTAETATWLSSVALDTSKIVVLCEHLSSMKNQNWNNGNPSGNTAITNALTSFVNGGGTLIQLCGHSHADYKFSNPWLTVFNGCNKFAQSDVTEPEFAVITGYDGEIVSPERTKDTASEDLWTLCVLRPNSRKIDFVRFGAGSDRSFTF